MARASYASQVMAAADSRYGCTAPNSQTLNLIVALADEVDPTFLSCMRMAVLEPEEMLKLEARGAV